MWGWSHENLEAEVSGSQKQNLGFYLTQWLLVGQSDQEVGLRTEIEMKRVTSQVPPTPRALALVELFSKQPSSRTNAFEKMNVILTFVLQEVVKYIYYLLLSQKQFVFPLVIRLRFCLEATHPYFRFMWIWCDPTHILDLDSRRGCCCSVAKLCLQTHGLQHTKLPCPSLSPGVYSNACPLSQWCHPNHLVLYYWE